MRKILFRLDAGRSYGYGHLSRNLTLSKVFQKHRIDSHFLIKTDDKTGVADFIKNNGYTNFSYHCLSSETSKKEDVKQIVKFYKKGYFFLVLDSYVFDFDLQNHLRSFLVKWAQFDYKVSEKILADMVINANISAEPSDYKDLVKPGTKLCVGADYAIIREDIRDIERKPQSNRILISMGFGRYSRAVTDIIKFITLDDSYLFDLITQDEGARSLLDKRRNVFVYNSPKDISGIYSKCSIAIVAGGVTTYEMAYFEVPMILMPYADNQIPNAKAWDESNYGISFLGTDKLKKRIQKKGLSGIFYDLEEKFKNRTLRVEGLGAKRIARNILSIMCCKNFTKHARN